MANFGRLKNKYVEKIVHAMAESDTNRAFERLLDEHRTPGEALEPIAHRLGVVEIRAEALPFEGGVFEGPKGLVIKTNSLSSMARQKFTVAHEIAHLVMAKHFRSRKSCSSVPLERTCDHLASELVMPRQAVAELMDGQETPSKLVRIADHFGVSLHMAAVRLRSDLRLWRRSIGLWEFGNVTNQLWFVGPRPWTESKQSFDVFLKATQTPGAIEARELCWRGAGLTAVSINVLHLGKGKLLATTSEGISSSRKT
jgi:hypothetical protein